MTQDDDFEALLEASLSAPRRRFTAGDKVRATVTQVCAERLILDLGEGQDALMELDQLGPERRLEVKVGDSYDAFVLSIEDRVPLLGLTPGRGAGGRVDLETARHTGVPVQGVVTEVNKGGYVVEVGATRCFCPLGAMDVRFIEDTAAMVGQRLLFRVTEMRGPRDVVLSRRAVMEEENARRAAETREKLVPGGRLRGKVTSIRDFGAFVDLGGIDGLVPSRELGYGWTRAHDAVTVGQEVDVEVLSVEPGKDGRERIALSMRALMEDPFVKVAEELEPGCVVAGTVTRIQPFGAFVELVPGVEGLIHVSAFGRRIGHPSDAVDTGQVVAVRVDGVDAAARRISLHHADQAELVGGGPGASETTASGVRILRRGADPAAAVEEPQSDADSATDEPTVPRAPAPPPVAPSKVGDVVTVTVDQVAKFGIFVTWPAGRGLVPGRELGLPRDTDLRRHFPPGSTFTAVVLEIRDDGKVALSKTAVERAEERATTDAWLRDSTRPAATGLGTLADRLQRPQD